MSPGHPKAGRLAVLALLSAAACYPALKLEPSDAPQVLSRQLLEAPDPSRPGPLPVGFLFYGSGTDRNRPEYRDSVRIETPTVDASKLVDLGQSADERNDYWGFTPKEMPLNGRVWYPEQGDGPFPLVLIAHGNHDMRDFSDPGYGWLGELLASRGYIVASLDMNFINGGIRGENDARGWFFLKHLEQWREWNGEDGNPFRGRVDLGRVALIGHSRGGEAVGHAAAFNRLTHYPDDGNFTFDFGFGIRSIIAIAPVDGQYRPADTLVPVRDVNYLVFHGSHDGDVSGFMGLRQYQRVEFSEDFDGFKALVFVYRANHGQWNTVWGPNDNGRRSARILDLRTLMPGEEQRQFGRVYVSAFLDATLKGDSSYLPLFRDHRVAGEWLPPTMYTTRFETSTFRPLATFEEDIDLTTAAHGAVTIEADSLATWREGLLQLRTANSPTEGSSQYNRVVTLGWNNRIAGEDTTRVGRPASYTLTLPEDIVAWRLPANGALQFLLVPTEAMPGPRAAPKDTTEADSTRATPDRRGEDRDEDDEDDEKPPIDLSIEVEDAAGVKAKVALSRYGVIRRPLESYILRRRDIEEDRFGSLSEIVLQSYAIPLADFAALEPRLDLASLSKIRFLFDRSPAGTVLVDDIGFARLGDAWLVEDRPEVAAQSGGAGH